MTATPSTPSPKPEPRRDFLHDLKNSSGWVRVGLRTRCRLQGLALDIASDATGGSAEHYARILFNDIPELVKVLQAVAKLK